MTSREKVENLSYIVPRDPSIKCWDDRVKLSAPWTKTIMDDLEEEVSIDKLKVYLRLKPSSALCSPYTIINSTTLESEAPRESVSYKNVSNGVGKLVHKFTFTSILNPTSSQTTIFDTCVLSNLKKFLHGENFLLLAYGTTSAGKTFTMQGTIEHPGIIPRAMDFVFNSLREKIEPSSRFQPYRSNEFCLLNDDLMRKEMIHKNFILNLDLAKYQRHPETSYLNYKTETTMATAYSSGFVEGYENMTFREMQDRLSNSETFEVPDNRFCVWISMVEVYNEQVYDLLEVPDEKGGRTKLCYGEDESGNVYIKNLKYVNVASGHEAFQVLQFGRTNLHLAPTALNNTSSRSHCICTITVAKFISEENAILSRFSFCDLAGKERAKKTFNVGDRLAESKSINTSLSILVKCLTTIKENQTNKDKKMIPFRESKLTRLFKDAMTGKEKLSMIVNVTTEPNLFDETLDVLKFSAIAQQIVPKNIFSKPKRVRHVGKSRFSRLVVKSREASNMIDWDTSTVIDNQSRVDSNQSNQAYRDLLSLVDELKRNLAEEREKNEKIEMDVRSEVAEEFKKLIQKQSENNQNRLESETSRLQDLFEKKEKRLKEYCKKLEGHIKKRKLENAAAIDVEGEENIKEMKKELNYLTTENYSLREQLNNLGQKNSSLVADVTRITFELTEKNRLIDQLERKTKASDAGTDELVKELQAQLEAANARNSEFKDLLNDAATEHKELLENNQFLREENDAFEKDLAIKTEMVEELQTEVAELQKLLAQRTEMMEELENREWSINEELKAAQDKIEDLTTKAEMVEKLKTEVAELQKLLAERTVMTEVLEIKERTVNKELEAAQNKIEDLASKAEMVEKLKTEVAELQKLLAERTVMTEDLEIKERTVNEEFKAAQNKIEDLASKAEMVEELKKEVAEVQKLLAERTVMMEELENRERTINEELEAARNKIEEISRIREDEANERNAEINTLQKEIKRLNMQLIDSVTEDKSTLERSKTEKEILLKEMLTLSKELEQIRKEKKELEEKLDRKHKDSEFDKRKYESEIASYQKKMEALEYQSNVLTRMKDQAEKSANDTREDFELLQLELDNKDKELKSFTDNRQQMFTNYEKEIRKLKDENERIRKDLLYHNEVLMKDMTPLKSNQTEIQKLKESLKKKDEEIFKLKSAAKSPPRIEITAPESDVIESSSSRENSPFREIKKKINRNHKKENTPDRLAKQIEQMSLSLAVSTAKKSKKRVDQLEESVHPCTLKGNARKGRKGGKTDKDKKEKEPPAPVKKETKCNKKLFTENDFDNMENLDASIVEPEIPRLRPRKN